MSSNRVHKSPTSTNAGFVSLGKGIYIKKPLENTALESISSADAPSLILIFGWMAAAMPHLLKYTKAYDDLYPHATQILVQCEAAFFWQRESTVRKYLMPVVEVLEAMGYIEPAKRGDKSDASPLKILTHCFSNGGSCTFSTVLRLISSRQFKVNRPIASALILDSTPGYGRYEDSLHAFGMSFKNPILYYCIYVCLFAVYTIAWARGNLVNGNPTLFVTTKEDLNSENLLWINKKTPRLYLYSEKDELVSPEAVEEHANEAKSKGLVVELEKFSDTGHVCHARGYPERYWGAVKEVWERAVVSE